MAKRALKLAPAPEVIKLNLGCGTKRKDGFIGVDRRKFPEVDLVTDLNKRWPWKDESVHEILMDHVLEHFSGVERVHIFNEMDRVLERGGTAVIITPAWSSCRAYGDFTHQWPPVSEQMYAYLSREWRLREAPDTDIKYNPEGYDCNFEVKPAWSGLHPELAGRADQTKHWWLTFGKEAASDLMATITKP